MKKFIALIALVMFLGGMSAPVFASNNSELVKISLADEDPKKDKKAKKSDAKSSECTGEKKSECTGEKKSECTGEKKEAGSDCSKSCGGK